MDIQSQVSILFDANTQPLKALQSQLNRLSSTLNKTSAATNKQGDSLDRLGKKFSDQGLANIQAGLVQLSNYSLHLSQNLNNMFEKAQNRYVAVDQALNQLRITMGLTGANAIDQMAPNKALVGQYEDIKDTIERLARTTQFTAVELTNLAQNFRRAGKSIDETKSLTNLAQRLTAASGGTLQLTEAGDMLLNTMSATGRTSSDLEVSLDRLVNASQNTRLSVEDMREAYASLSGGLQGLKADAGELDSFLYSMVAGYKELGKSPREATDAIRQSVAAYTGLFSAVNRAVTRGGGKSTEDALKKAYGRVQIKRNMLLLALGVADGGAELEKIATKAYGRVTKNTLQAARDLMAQQKLTGPGGSKLSGTAFVNLVKEARQNLINMGKGAVEVESILKDAFGTQALVVFSRAVDALERSTGKTFEEVQTQTSKALGDLGKASNESLKSLASRIKLLESAEDALSNAIFKHDLVAQGAIETYTELVSTAADLAGKNTGLAKSIAALGRAAQVASGFVTDIGFALTAMATFSIGLRYAQVDLGARTSTLSRIFSSFYTVFLAPTLTVMMALAGAVGLLGAGFVGYVKRMTGAESTAEGFSIVLGQITNKVKVLGGMLRLAFGGEGLGSSVDDMKQYLRYINIVADAQAQNAKDRLILESNANAEAKRAARTRMENNTAIINSINDENQSVIRTLGAETIKAMRTSDGKLLEGIFETGQKAINIFKGVVSFLDAASKPLGLVFSFALDTLSAALNVIMFPLNAIGGLINFITDSTDGASVAMSGLGTLVGVFFGIKIALAAISGGLGTVLKLGISLLSVFNPTRLADYVTQLRLQRANYEALNPTMSRSKSILFHMIEGYQLWQNGIKGATARLVELNAELQKQQMAPVIAQGQTLVDQAAVQGQQIVQSTAALGETQLLYETSAAQQYIDDTAAATRQYVEEVANAGAQRLKNEVEPLEAEYSNATQALAQARADENRARAEVKAKNAQAQAEYSADVQSGVTKVDARAKMDAKKAQHEQQLLAAINQREQASLEVSRIKQDLDSTRARVTREVADNNKKATEFARQENEHARKIANEHVRKTKEQVKQANGAAREHAEQMKITAEEQRQTQQKQKQQQLDARTNAIRQQAVSDLKLQEDAQGKVGYKTGKTLDTVMKLGAATFIAGGMVSMIGEQFELTDNKAFAMLTNGMMLIGGISSAVSALIPLMGTFSIATLTAFWPFLLIGAAIGGIIYAVSKWGKSTPPKSSEETRAEQTTLNLGASSAPQGLSTPLVVAPSVPPDMTAATASSISSRSSLIGSQQPVTKISIENFHSNIKGEAQDPKQFARLIKRELRDSDFMNA